MKGSSMSAPTAIRTDPHALDRSLEVATLESVALRRLVGEVSAGGVLTTDVTAYNRTYHRHNR